VKQHRLLLACVCLLALGLATVLLGACGQGVKQPGAGPTGTPSLSGQPTQPGETPPSAEPTPQARQPLTLTLWTTEAFSPTQRVAQGRILAAQVASLDDLRLRFVVKQPYGQAGVQRYLLNTGAVVPDLLPDLAYVDVDEVDEIVYAGLAQPLDTLLSPHLVDALYGFAQEACIFEGRLYCLQVEADLDHLVYNSFRLSRAPVSWTAVLSESVPYVFPAGGEGGLVNDAFLVQYEAVGPRPEEVTSGPSFLDESSLVAVLQFYRDGASLGLFPKEILQLHTADDSWQAYRSGLATMAQVSAHRYLVERSQVVFAMPAPVPSIAGPAAPISRGWALVLITPDPARQAAAARFMELWLSPETNASWNLAADTLPTLQSSLAYWEPEDAYFGFLHQQLLVAYPRPTVPGYSQVSAAFQQAVEAVLKGERTPEEAAAEVMNSGP
jgi:multiple sugar transport system substrate-binding protein